MPRNTVADYVALQHLSVAEAAERLGVDRTTVLTVERRNNLRFRRDHTRCARRAEIAPLAHLSVTEAAAVLGITPDALSSRARRLGLSFRDGRDGRARRQVYAALTHLSVPEVADRLGITRDSVRQAARRYGLSFAPVEGEAPPERPRLRAVPDGRAPEPVPPVTAEGAMLSAPGWCADRDAAILKAGGRYSKLARLSERWGLPMKRVEARWHVLRAAR